MKKFSEQLNTRAQSVKLRAEEKRELRERVVSYMEYHPLPASMKETNNSVNKVPAQTAEPFATFKIPFTAIFKYSAVTAALFLVVIPFVAERAVPGDALYAVKVQFNEELRSTLTFDTYQKVEWETERLNRRIAEARLLASEGRLTEEAEADVAEAVRVHSANAQREIAELRNEDEDAATIAAIALDTTLELQSSSLKGEDDVALLLSSESIDNDNRPINLIASAIDESRTKPEESVSSSTPPAYAKLMARVEENTTRIYELLSALEKVAPAEELVDVKRRAEDMNRAIQEATETVSSDELVARHQLVSVIQRTQRLIVYMTELEVIKTIDIETLIPVVLTPEEKESQRKDLTTELTNKLKMIDDLSVQVTNSEIKAKVNFAQDQISETLEKMSTVDSFEEFKIMTNEATALAEDVFKILNLEQITLPSAVSTSTSTTTEEVKTENETASSTVTSEEEGEVSTTTSESVGSTTTVSLGAEDIVDSL